MTSTVNVVAPAEPADTPAPSRRRWWIRGLITLLVLAAFAPVVWWRVSVDRYDLTAGDVLAPGLPAAQNHAGDVTEYCYLFAAGQPIDLGFSVYNSGSHTVTLTHVGQLLGAMNQSVTVDTNTRGGMDGRASAAKLPVTIRPGDNRLLYFHLTPQADVTMASNSWSYTSGAYLRFTVLGGTRLQFFHIDDGRTVFTLAGVNRKSDACDRHTPPLG